MRYLLFYTRERRERASLASAGPAGLPPLNYGAAPRPLLRQLLLDGFAHLLAVGRLAQRLQSGQGRLHHLAHVLGRGGARLGHGLVDGGRDVGVTGLRGQIGTEDRELALLLVDQLLTARLLELL